MANIEIDDLRDKQIEMFDLKNTDCEFKFYYDETNNIRRFYLREKDFNESINSNFVLGGLVFEKTKTDLTDLYEKLNLQGNVNEVKLKHICTGDFLSCLKSKKIFVFLEFLIKSDLYIHFSSLNFLYFSIVDIVDSAETNSKEGDNIDFGLNRHLKDTLYKIVKSNSEEFIDLFFKYEYPNIKVDTLSYFVNDLIVLLKKSLNKYPFEIELLIKMLQESLESKSLIFIMDEENFTLINNFSTFYFRTICLFKNSKHIFDKEDKIEHLLNDITFISGETTIKNYEFVESKGNLYIQTSDIIIGLIGKYMTFINENSDEEIKLKISDLNDLQFANFEVLLELIDKSNKKNKAFFFSTVSNDDHKKQTLITKLIL